MALLEKESQDLSVLGSGPISVYLSGICSTLANRSVDKLSLNPLRDFADFALVSESSCRHWHSARFLNVQKSSENFDD